MREWLTASGVSGYAESPCPILLVRMCCYAADCKGKLTMSKIQILAED